MKKHPSGRPIRRPNTRDYSMRTGHTLGYRLPRLAMLHDEGPVDTCAVGFTAEFEEFDDGGAWCSRKRRR